MCVHVRFRGASRKKIYIWSDWSKRSGRATKMTERRSGCLRTHTTLDVSPYSIFFDAIIASHTDRPELPPLPVVIVGQQLFRLPLVENQDKTVQVHYYTAEHLGTTVAQMHCSSLGTLDSKRHPRWSSSLDARSLFKYRMYIGTRNRGQMVCT